MNHPDIIIPDRAWLETKISRFSKEDSKFILDLDGTITDPEKTSWAMLRKLEPKMPGYNQAADALHKIYHPHETDHTLSRERKNELMQEWWSRAAWLFSKYKIKADYLKDIDAKEIQLRGGMREAFDYFKAHNIPVHILSAGIHQTIEMILAHHDIRWDHITLTANQFVFDEEGNYTWFHPKQHIHADNKDEQIAVRNAQSKFHWRSNIILLGDNPPDIKMVDPLERDNTIAVGFCHDRRNWPVYANTFDIVVHSGKSDLWVLQWLMSRISL